MPVDNEDCELEEKQILPTTSSTQQGLPDSKEGSSKKTEGQAVTVPQVMGVMYSHPGRYQQV